MRIQQIVCIGFGFLSGLMSLYARAGDVHVLVKSELFGTNITYRYELINHTPYRMSAFDLGVTLVDPSDSPTDRGAPSTGTLTRLPTNTLWQPAPAISRDDPEMPDPRAGNLIPVPDPNSVTSPTGWLGEIWGATRVVGGNKPPESIARERYIISWQPPKPVDGGPLDVTGADAGQRLTGFSVRVPLDDATGPGSVGSLAMYTQGEFVVDLWSGTSVNDFYLDNSQRYRRRGKIVVSPSLEVSFLTIPDVMHKPVNSNTLVTVTANVVPLIYGNPSTSIKLESITCRGNCLFNEGYTGAAFGTDDREFQLQAPPVRGQSRAYDITYSVTDLSIPNKCTSPPGYVPPPGYIPPPGTPRCLPPKGSITTVMSTITINSGLPFKTPPPGFVKPPRILK